MTRRRLALLASVALAISGVCVASAVGAPAPGGSNYNWYRVAGGCDREPYGVIANFHRPDVRSEIVAQLGQMHAAGQRRLRIGIYHGRGLNTGTVMDSAGGDLSAQNRSNLAGLLAAVKQAGFAEIELAFHPIGPSDPTTWTEFRPDVYEENRSLISRLRPSVRGAGIQYRIDLANEAIPAPSQPVLLRYAQTLWRDYTRDFGRDDTVGFSLIGDEPARVAHVPEVYGDSHPHLLDIHFYGTGADEGARFRAADDTLRRAGYQQGWIIGEAYYDDAAAAGRFQSAIRATGRTVYYLLQWPLTRSGACADVDVAPPKSFTAYLNAGFGAAPTASNPTPTAAPNPASAALEPSLQSRRLRIDRRGRVALGLRCIEAATACSGTATLSVGKRRMRTTRYSVAPGRTTIHRIRLPSSVRRSLRRRGHLTGRVVVTAHAGGATAEKVFRVRLLTRRR